MPFLTLCKALFSLAIHNRDTAIHIDVVAFGTLATVRVFEWLDLRGIVKPDVHAFVHVIICFAFVKTFISVALIAYFKTLGAIAFVIWIM